MTGTLHFACHARTGSPHGLARGRQPFASQQVGSDGAGPRMDFARHGTAPGSQEDSQVVGRNDDNALSGKDLGAMKKLESEL